MAGRADLVALHRALALHRAAASRLASLRDQERIPADARCGRGYEAVSAGCALALRPRADGTGDVVALTPHNPGALFVFGGTPLEFFRQHLARDSAPTRGRLSGVSYTDFARGLVGPVNLPGTMVEIMAGITLAFRLRGQDRVGLVFSGEEETSTSAWHEGINFAAVQRCPLIVVVQAGDDASARAHTRTRGYAEKAAGYGISGTLVDANDAREVRRALGEAVKRARSGGGATLVEARGCPVSRRASAGNAHPHPHEGVSDPMATFRARLIAEGIRGASDLDEVERRARGDVRAACEQALAEAPATEEHALGGVLAADSASPPWYRREPPERAAAAAL